MRGIVGTTPFVSCFSAFSFFDPRAALLNGVLRLCVVRYAFKPNADVKKVPRYGDSHVESDDGGDDLVQHALKIRKEARKEREEARKRKLVKQERKPETREQQEMSRALAESRSLQESQQHAINYPSTSGASGSSSTGATSTTV